jgi:MoaA/NifB/PqqE/SkfB family radical SAM enzyme
VSGPAGRLPALQIHPTRRCNLRCLHCYSQSGPEVTEQLDLEVLLRTVGDAADLGYRVLAVSGGEPLLYEALPEVLRSAHECGLVTTVTTNGMRLNQRQLARLEPDTDLIAISLDGIPQSHAEMRGSSRAFDSMAARLPALRASGIPFGFIFTLTYHNVHELDWVARFAIEQGAQLLQIHPLEPVGRAAETLDESIPDLQENVYALVEACRLRGLYEDRIQIQVDLATLPGIAAHPEQIFADRTEIDSSAVFAEFMAPIVLETSGIVAPLQYGFPRAWAFGNVHDAPLRELAREWVCTRGSAFRRLCCDVRDSILQKPDAGVVNWYVEVHRAAEAHSPCWGSRTVGAESNGFVVRGQ